MILQAARKYRNVGQALDFSAGTSTEPGNFWSVEDEMNSYIQSPIPPPQTTDMIGYWTVQFKFFWLVSVTDYVYMHKIMELEPGRQFIACSLTMHQFKQHLCPQSECSHHQLKPIRSGATDSVRI
jgi:hypothetical protein